MKKILILGVVILMMGCRKSSPKPPEAALLIFPLQNSECTTGISLNSTTSQVEFRWQEAKHADTYELKVTNIFTNSTFTNPPTQALSAFAPLLKGVPYQWTVTTRNTETQEAVVSTAWYFYNAGTQTTFAPFPAQIISPESGASIGRDINNEITLEWAGADVDNDIQSYEIYVDTVDPPQLVIATPSVSISSIKASVQLDMVYYWKVVTIDLEGNATDSGVFSFRVVK